VTRKIDPPGMLLKEALVKTDRYPHRETKNRERKRERREKEKTVQRKVTRTP